ncbi:hypothetical protein AOLI_G00244380 [Acnodon oligacanthus]
MSSKPPVLLRNESHQAIVLPLHCVVAELVLPKCVIQSSTSENADDPSSAVNCFEAGQSSQEREQSEQDGFRGGGQLVSVGWFITVVVLAKAEILRSRLLLQTELKEMIQQRIQEKQKKLQELEQAVNALKRCAQTAVEDTERIWTELICSMEKKRSELTELIRAQEKAELSAAEDLLEKLEQEIADLKRRNTELEQLSLTEDPIHFLQSFQSLSVSSGSEDSSSISDHHHLSFDGVRSSLSDLKERLEEFCREEFRKIPPRAAAAPSFLSEPKSREDFLQYYCQLTLDPNTAIRTATLLIAPGGARRNLPVKGEACRDDSAVLDRRTNPIQVGCSPQRAFLQLQFNKLQEALQLSSS